MLFAAWAWLLRLGADASAICGASTAGPAILMWIVMMVAMMTPSALPMMLTFARATSGVTPGAERLALSTLFIGVYVAVWAAFGAAAGTAEWLLSRHGDIQPGKAIHPYAAAALLIAAGLYQWSAVKGVCLAKCHARLDFVTERYRGGYAAALQLGFTHSIACLGCCFLLMLLAWVGGSMNLAWMAALTVFVAVEKLLGAQPAVLRLSALALLGAGAAMLLAQVAQV
jgi:predicted metal-binding membrane protein